jgi:hypothetical protein
VSWLKTPALEGLSITPLALKRPLVVALAVALCGISVFAIAIESAYAGAIVFGGILLLFVVAQVVLNDFVSGVLAYTVLIVLEEFCKRSVFVLPDQNPPSQYAVLMPAYVAMAVLLVKAMLQQRLRLDGQGRLFILFLLLACASTWLNPRIRFLPKAIGRIIGFSASVRELGCEPSLYRGALGLVPTGRGPNYDRPILGNSDS